jgi:hypothetical protein
MVGGYMPDNGTIEATDSGAAALGFVSATVGNAKLSSDATASLVFGNTTNAHASGTATIAATSTGTGSIVHGLALQTVAGNAVITSDASGSFVGGDCDTGGTIEAGTQAFGAIAHGFANTSGILRVETLAEGGTVLGQAIGGGTIISDADGAHARGSATGSGDIIADGIGARAEGNVSAAGAVIQATGLGSFASGNIQVASGTIKAIEDGAHAIGTVQTLQADILASGKGSFAGGYALTNDITASGTGSFAYGASGGGAISATNVGSAQFAIGTNGQSQSLQVGNTTTGIRLTSGGSAPTSSLHNGDLWNDGTKIRVRDNGISTNLVPRLTKSITIETPTVGDEPVMFYTNVAITVTQITAVIVGSTSVTFNISHGTSRAAVTNDVMSADDVADSTTTGNITTSFGGGDPDIPADSFVCLTVSAQSAQPTELHVTVEYTED